MAQEIKNVVLIIRDGWGINPNPHYNAIFEAKTPNADAFLEKYPHSILEASGLAVGVPKGYQGSSEVGHLNMGAGRIVKQEITRINEEIEIGRFFEHPNFQRVIKNCLENNKALHIMGLVQNEGVHSHQEHLFAIMKYAKLQGVSNCWIHFFADGRDTPPRSAFSFLGQLNEKIEEYKIGKIATIMGRYYAMDRGKNWKITSKAYEAIVRAKGLKMTTAEEAIKESYKDEKISDEYIQPSIIGDYNGVKDGDSVIHFNYRQDRAIQITKAFIEETCPEREDRVNVIYCGLTRYYDSFLYYILEPMDETVGMKNLLGKLVSNNDLRQLRIAETQKFKHVTSFFNGKLLKPFPKEERVEVKSDYDPSSFAEHPEMNAYDVTDEVIKRIKSNKYSLIILNFANCDMVGHTGNYSAAKKAVEIVDECVGKVVKEILVQKGIALVTADHGNVEEMIDYETGLVKTSHTINPVEFIYIAENYKEVELEKKGILSDIAPTILSLLKIKQPAEMTAKNLIKIKDF